MKSRQGVVEIFSSFLQVNANTAQGWLIDPRLRRNMQRHYDAATETAEGYWSLYWHQVWQAQSHPLAADHLNAYIQEACYWTANKIATSFPSQQTVADLFQTALLALPKILKSFNPQFGSGFKSYAERTFSNVIKESLRQTQQISICSDWALLNKLSQKRLTESLQHGGLDPSKITAYSLACRCYQELYTANDSKSSRKLESPTPGVWAAIVKLYNQQRSPDIPTATQEALEKYLLAIAKAVRAYQAPKTVSTNTPLPGQETGELQDYLPGEADNLMDEMITQEEIAERQAQKATLDRVLDEAIGQLDPQLQTLLQVYYGKSLTQQEIAQQLDMKQYTISRRLTSIRSTLIRALAKWAQETLHVPLTPTVLDSMNTVLEDWLTARMQQP
jgi:RNA polymerase sigma factor (sigma-70 family)